MGDDGFLVLTYFKYNIWTHSLAMGDDGFLVLTYFK